MRILTQFSIVVTLCCLFNTDCFAQDSAKVRKNSNSEKPVVESGSGLNIPLDLKQAEPSTELFAAPESDQTAIPVIDGKVIYSTEPGKLEFEFKPEQ